MPCNPGGRVVDLLENGNVPIRAVWQRISVNEGYHIALACQIIALGLVTGAGHAILCKPSWACVLLKQACEKQLVVGCITNEVRETMALRGRS